MTLSVIHVISLMTFRINYVNYYDLKIVNISHSATQKTQMPAPVVIRQA